MYDNMVDDPIEAPSVGGRDCRATRLTEIKNAHFTLCQKPWTCRVPEDPADIQHLCSALHRRWFEIRAEVEARVAPHVATPPNADRYHRGACARGVYTPIAFDRRSGGLSTSPAPR